MQSLIRSKSAGVTGGRGTAGAGPGRDLLYLLGRSRVASSSFVVQMSWTSCWRVRSGGAPVWLVSRSMPHPCAAQRMAVVSVGASGRRRMACRALLYLCQAPWSSSAGNCSVVGRVLSGRVAAGGGRLHLGFYGVPKSQNQLQSEILLFLSNYTMKSIFSGVSPPPTLQIRNFLAHRSTIQG